MLSIDIVKKYIDMVQNEILGTSNNEMRSRRQGYDETRLVSRGLRDRATPQSLSARN